MPAKKHWFIFYDGALLLNKNGVPFCARPPLKTSAPAYEIAPGCFAVELISKPVSGNFVDLRQSYEVLSEETFVRAGRAAQILRFYRESKFCPACACPTKELAAHSKICPECKKELYPVISAACMVLVRKKDKVLMIRGRNYKYKFYGLVAGFLEPGETLEQCAAREVFEETGLKIKNIKYFGSQPWPFPGGLMVGFTADYASGKLRIQKTEILDAKFFTKKTLPLRPGKLSLARQMTDDWLKNN